ncbi:hypothetical protein L6452_14994 [Arctium lappa]|uniref:Uncharacterized protein n=1 Tax=Arctium lappa TaxID=4217 RepID=A0ACB9CML9_ARCLA|nr:hypothetical protein L6452_14994 [Arctium lappa]
MDSAKFALQARFYSNDLMMQLGTDTRPPVLINEDEFTQWQDRFINFIERQTNGENMMKSFTEGSFIRPKNDIPLTDDEIKREKAGREAKSNLMLALPNSIYNRIDCFKHNPNMIWTQLKKIMLGSSVATQIRQTRFMNNFEEFKAKDNESLKVTFDRFCTVINDLRKIKVEKTALETNLKFLNALQSEWNKSCHRLRNDVRISTMQIQELYEILMTDESLVVEKKAKMDKKKKTVDPVALITKQLTEQALSDNAYTGSTEDDGEALQKAMILLSQHYQRKFQPKSGSNSSRFTSGPKVKVPELKNDACYNCGKSGHMSKECRAKEEFWLDYSDDEASNVEIAQMCLIGDDRSDDSETDEDEVYSEFDSNFITSHMNIMINALSDLHRALSARSKKQIWRAKLKFTDSKFEGDRYVDKFYHSDSFVVCNKISKYSIKQMIQISKNVSYSSSDSSLDDYGFSSDDCAYYSDDIFHASHIKYAYCFPTRTATNKHGPKFKWILHCLVSNICMTKLIKIIKVMRGRSQGDVKETKSSNVYLLIKIRSKILFSQLHQILLLFLLRTPQFIQGHSKEVYRLELKQQRHLNLKDAEMKFFLKSQKASQNLRELMLASFGVLLEKWVAQRNTLREEKVAPIRFCTKNRWRKPGS